MAFFGIGHLEHIPPNPKNGSRGVRGGGGCILGAFSHIFGAILGWIVKKGRVPPKIFLFFLFNIWILEAKKMTARAVRSAVFF